MEYPCGVRVEPIRSGHAKELRFDIIWTQGEDPRRYAEGIGRVVSKTGQYLCVGALNRRFLNPTEI